MYTSYSDNCCTNKRWGKWHWPPPKTILVSLTVWERTQRASWMDRSASSRICWVAPRSTMVHASPSSTPVNSTAKLHSLATIPILWTGQHSSCRPSHSCDRPLRLIHYFGWHYVLYDITHMHARTCTHIKMTHKQTHTWWFHNHRNHKKLTHDKQSSKAKV